MPINLYLDTSAILKLLIDEDGSQNMKAYFYKFKEFHMLSLCFAETLSMLKVKYLYRKEITKKKHDLATALLLIYCEKNIFRIHDAKTSILNNAFPGTIDLVDKYGIDFIDAFQIYYLKEESLLQHTRLITADSPLEKVAKAEKLNVWNCLKDKVP